ncbi:MAG: hypothetical protein CM15mP62_26490 [Rhodospirillaceae bacterium]|nr:MAG: hypothetical protein CM15mP62_26490 [Rhodospirillaceae bacterium]
MSYTLNQLLTTVAKLYKQIRDNGLEKVRQAVSKACNDQDFISQHLGPENNEPRKILYEDPNLGFCILAHVYTGERGSPPHDHGPSWAVYGQAAGKTEMTDWRCLKKPTSDEPGLVEKVKKIYFRAWYGLRLQNWRFTFTLPKGYNKINSCRGINMDNIIRDTYMVAPD